MLELDEGQLSRPVLRGRGGSNTSLLPGLSVNGSSQRGRACARPDPAGPGGRRHGAGGVGHGDVGGPDVGGQPRSRGARKWVVPSALLDKRGAWGVGRENSGQVDVGDHAGFPGARKWVAPSALSADLLAGSGQNGLKWGRKGVFLRNMLRGP